MESPNNPVGDWDIVTPYVAIRIVSLGLDAESISALRANIPKPENALVEVYSRSVTDEVLTGDASTPLVVICLADKLERLKFIKDRQHTELILIGSPDTDSNAVQELTTHILHADHLQWLPAAESEGLNQAKLGHLLSTAVNRLIAATRLSTEIGKPFSGVTPSRTDGVVVIDRYDHILFLDHQARSLGMPAILRVIEQITTENYPLAGTVHGELSLPNMQSAALELDARSVSYLDKALTLIRVQPSAIEEMADNPNRKNIEQNTGLLSRDSLQAILDSRIDDPACGNDVLLMIDLDRMKIITEGVGHHASDHAIAVTGARLHGLCRSTDILARIGNDEFALLITSEISESNLTRLADKLLAEIAEPVSLPDKRPLHLTASMGSSKLSQGMSDVARLFRQADIALAHARQQGGNRHLAYEDSFSDTLRRRWDMEAKLREAIAREQFHLEFQPLIESGSGRIVAAESLLRWHDPTHGKIYPDQFIPLLEETGLIVNVGEWIIKTACLQAKAWQEAGAEGFRISVNVSPIQVEEKGLIEVVASALEESGLAPEFLVLEITEQLLLEYTERAQEVLDTIAETGVKIFLDDFGTGYSSLGYLKKFPVCGIKIDRSFIDSLPDGEDDRAITLAILDMCKHMNLWVIPEGVETAAQGTFLTANGATLQQGFFYSKPVPATQFSELLLERKAS